MVSSRTWALCSPCTSPMDSQLSALSLWTFPPMDANWISITVDIVEDINIVDVSISCHIQLKVNL